MKTGTIGLWSSENNFYCFSVISEDNDKIQENKVCLTTVYMRHGPVFFVGQIK